MIDPDDANLFIVDDRSEMRTVLLGMEAGSDPIWGGPPPGSAKLRPNPPYVPKTPATKADFDRLERAEQKRARKAAQRANSCQGGERGEG